jgi:hypothetical protein|tara:strand:+ start:3175 stop:3771 length:597 start_codon:yes stop_codon:yes gene_type:complete
MKAKTQTTFEKLSAINVNTKTAKKGGLNYLSWAWSWSEVKKACPDANYTIYENLDGLFYHNDGKTAWVKTGVTIEGVEHIEYLPIMNFSNKSVNLENITSVDVNKAIQRSITKASARHGLGMYIYLGEDYPEVAEAAVVVTKSDGLLPLTVKDHNWSKVSKYVVEHKAMGVKRILDSLSVKYKISSQVKTAISKMISV